MRKSTTANVRDYDRDPNIEVFKRRGSVNHGSALGHCLYEPFESTAAPKKLNPQPVRSVGALN